MTNKLLSFSILTFITISFFAQDQTKEMDKNAIRSMCGCFDVGFHFAETFSYSEDTNYMPSKIKHAGALEFAQLVEETEDKVVIQHLLIVGSEESPYIIKHWRQDWVYENNDFYMFNHDNKWTYKNINDNNVKGQWTQKVYQVDDSPRYEGTASWVHVDGKHYWENTTDAPLPRREYTKRSDYNVTIRTNRHEIVNKGWVHDQDNKKIIRETGKEDIILAEEKGINNYNRVDESKCKAAAEWWQENKDFWKQVRISWDEIYGLNKNLELKDKVEGKRLYDVLFGMDVKTSKKKINKTIESYVKEDS
tara:strand:- start:326 stop:1243 length:918 start_codon:yes stop_codon:yes gene_type:complete